MAQGMYKSCETAVRCAVGETEECKVEVELHEGSILGPFSYK